MSTAEDRLANEMTGEQRDGPGDRGEPVEQATAPVTIAEPPPNERDKPQGKPWTRAAASDGALDPVRSKSRKALFIALGAAVALVIAVNVFIAYRLGNPDALTNATAQEAQYTHETATTPIPEDDSILALGIEYYESGDYDAAILALNRALTDNPELGEAYSYRGLSYFSLGKYKDAIVDFTKALHYLELRADVLTVRGIAYYFEERYAEAIGDFSRALELDPTNNNALAYRALAYDATDRADLAEADRASYNEPETDYGRNGYYEETYSNGGKYAGNWKNDQRSGQGTYYFSPDDPDKVDKYVGNWEDHWRSGQGILYWLNGDRYEGNWKDDLRNGQGILYYHSGDEWNRTKYAGNWKDGERSGQGTLYWTNGAYYVGNWAKDTRSGYGTTYRSDGTIEKRGNWDGDTFLG